MRRSTFVWTGSAVITIALIAAGAAFAPDIGSAFRTDGAATGTPAHAPHAAWDDAMTRLAAAIEREDRSSLLYEWRTAYAVGIALRSWQPMITLGDAAQRIAVLDRQREPFEREARGAYLLALRAARRAHSNAGLMATADGFERLGDAEMAAQVRRLAARFHADAARP